MLAWFCEPWSSRGDAREKVRKFVARHQEEGSAHCGIPTRQFRVIKYLLVVGMPTMRLRPVKPPLFLICSIFDLSLGSARPQTGLPGRIHGKK